MWIVERKDGDEWIPTMMAYHSEQEAVWVAKDYQRTLRCEYRAAEYERRECLDEIECLREILHDIEKMTDAEDAESYRSDDREGCLDAVNAKAKSVLS